MMRKQRNFESSKNICKETKNNIDEGKVDRLQIIEKLELSVRAVNCLKSNNVFSVGQLLNLNEDEFKNTINVGEKTFDEVKKIKDMINKYGNTDISNEMLDNFDNDLSNDTYSSLSVRARNCLESRGIYNIDELLKIDEMELRGIDNLGVRTLNEIISVIKEHKNKYTNNNKTYKSIFYDKRKGYYVENIEIKDLKFSKRVINALKHHDLNTIADVSNLDIAEIYNLKNLGKKSASELADKLDSIKKTLKYDYSNKQGNYINRISEKITNEYIRVLKVFDEKTLEYNVRVDIQEYFENKEINSLVASDITDKEIISKIYDENYLSNVLKTHILDIIEENESIELVLISLYLPKTVRNNTEFIQNMLNDLVDEKKLERIDNEYILCYPSIYEFLDTIKNENHRFVYEQRIKGISLADIGRKLDLSRERIRQLEAKVKKIKIPKLKEDRYKWIYKKYAISRELFETAFDKKEMTYSYLSYRYDKGIIDQELILENTEIPINIRKRAEGIINKNYIVIKGERIRKDANEISEYLLKNRCKEGKNAEELHKIYNDFLKVHGLDDNKELSLSKRNLEARMDRSDNVVRGINKSIRYYHYSNIDYKEVTETLGLRKYKDVEISTLKLFTENTDTMDDLNIRDEYELHNIMKRIYPIPNDWELTFARMPMIKFGETDRINQSLDIMREYGELSKQEFAKLYQNEYGIRADTFLASLSKTLGKYENNGLYSLDVKEIPQDKVIKLKSILEKEIYLKSEMQDILKEILGNDEGHEFLTDYNMYKLGFRYSNSVIYSNKYRSLEEYFENLILKYDIFDSTKIDSSIKNNQTYYYILKDLKDALQVIEYKPGVYINIRRLKTQNVDEEDLKEYINCVDRFIKDDTFTIRHLEKLGFVHELDDLGFDDRFYSSIIQSDPRFKFIRMNEIIILKKSDIRPTIEDLISSTVVKHRSIDTYDLVDIIYEDYGVKLDRWALISSIKDSEFHHDYIMEKVYIDYDEYFEEV